MITVVLSLQPCNFICPVQYGLASEPGLSKYRRNRHWRLARLARPGTGLVLPALRYTQLFCDWRYLLCTRTTRNRSRGRLMRSHLCSHPQTRDQRGISRYQHAIPPDNAASDSPVAGRYRHHFWRCHRQRDFRRCGNELLKSRAYGPRISLFCLSRANLGRCSLDRRRWI